MTNTTRKKIAYVLPDISISGGTAIVIKHITELVKLGHDTMIVTLHNNVDTEWFEEKNIKVLNTKAYKAKKIKCDILIATHWSTVEFVLKAQALRKIYFVQSDERRFGHLSLSEFLRCNKTYEANMEFMTEALWIQRWLKEEFNKDAYYIPNGIDTKIFHKVSGYKKGSKKRVLLEGSINLPFKGMMLSFLATNEVEADVWAISNYGKPRSYVKCNRFFSGIPLDEMKKIYSSCDVFLKMSRVEGFFGPPLESMACGCPVVVAKCSGYDEYIKDGYNALVVDEGDYKAAKTAIEKILTNKALREKLVKNGFKTVEKWGWDKSIKLLINAVEAKEVKTFYTQKHPNRYDYKKEVSKALYVIEIMENFNQNVLSEKDRWIEHLEKDINILNNHIRDIETSPEYILLSKIKKAIKKVKK